MRRFDFRNRAPRARVLSLLLALGALALPAAQAESASCSTVARRGEYDAEGHLFGTRFRDELAINAAGDVLFVARPRHTFEKLYLGRADGSLTIVTKTLAQIPDGGVIGNNQPFRQVSLNDAGHLAFLANTSRGRTVVVRRFGGPMVPVATAGRLSPIPNVRYQRIRQLSRIGADGRVAFAVDLDDGRQAVFTYDSLTKTAAPLLFSGVLTAEGVPICSFDDLERNDAGELVLVAGTRATCDDEDGPLHTKVLLVTEAGIETVLAEGDASPTPDTTFRRIVGRPGLNAAGDVLLRALLGGSRSGEQLFVRDRGTAEVRGVIGVGSSLPGGGTVRELLDAHLATDGAVLAHLELRGDPSTRFGLFRFAASTAAVLTGADQPPSDAFTPPSRYRGFEPRFVASADGTRTALVAGVRDGAPPRSKSAVLRCAD